MPRKTISQIRIMPLSNEQRVALIVLCGLLTGCAARPSEQNATYIATSGGPSGSTSSAAPISPPSALPPLTWPPPLPTAIGQVDHALVIPPRATTLREVANRLSGALDRAGFSSQGWYEVPGGFAIATHIEHIDNAGTPAEPRWTTGVTPPRFGSLAYFRTLLFGAMAGRYRVFLFVVTSDPFVPSVDAPTQSVATHWLGGGARISTLPDEIGNIRVNAHHAVWALIYEFAKSGEQVTALADDASPLSASTHLINSGIQEQLRVGL